MLSGNKPTSDLFLLEQPEFLGCNWHSYVTDGYACVNGNRAKICDSIITRVIYLKGITHFRSDLSRINLNNQVPIHCDFLRFQPSSLKHFPELLYCFRVESVFIHALTISEGSLGYIVHSGQSEMSPRPVWATYEIQASLGHSIRSMTSPQKGFCCYGWICKFTLPLCHILTLMLYAKVQK